MHIEAGNELTPNHTFAVPGAKTGFPPQQKWPAKRTTQLARPVEVDPTARQVRNRTSVAPSQITIADFGMISCVHFCYVAKLLSTHLSWVFLRITSTFTSHDESTY